MSTNNIHGSNNIIHAILVYPLEHKKYKRVDVNINKIIFGTIFCIKLPMSLNLLFLFNNVNSIITIDIKPNELIIR